MFNYLDADGDPRFGKIIGHVLVVLIVIVLLFGAFGTIGAGERGVKTRLGKVSSVLQPGLYFKLPFIDHVTKMDVHTQSLTATQDAPLNAASNDLQDTQLAVVVNYHISPNLVGDIYTQYGEADTYYLNVVDPLIVATIKAVASQYTAQDQIQKRSEMSDKALIALQAAFEDKNVIIEKADITNVAFSPAYTAAIEAKVTAVQLADAAENKKRQTQAEADQKVITAQADAEAIKIQAQAINSQGGADYVLLQQINKWNGAGCTSYCGVAQSTGLLINGK